MGCPSDPTHALRCPCDAHNMHRDDQECSIVAQLTEISFSDCNSAWTLRRSSIIWLKLRRANPLSKWFATIKRSTPTGPKARCQNGIHDAFLARTELPTRFPTEIQHAVFCKQDRVRTTKIEAVLHRRHCTCWFEQQAHGDSVARGCWPSSPQSSRIEPGIQPEI